VVGRTIDDNGKEDCPSMIVLRRSIKYVVGRANPLPIKLEYFSIL
jgi:hypothetical protein